MRYVLLNPNGFATLARTPFYAPKELPRQLICPFNDEVPCADWCPMFEVEEVSTRIRVLLSCVPVRRLIAIDKEDTSCGS